MLTDMGKEGYQNIREVVEIASADVGMMTRLRATAKVSKIPGDCLAALIVATHTLQHPKLTARYDKDIVLVTDCESETNWEGIEDLRTEMNRQKIALTVA